MKPRPAHNRVRLLARILALSLATLAVQGSTAATVSDPAGEVGVARTSVSSVTAIGGSGARDAPLRAFYSLRHFGWEQLREAGSGAEHGQPGMLADLERLPPVPGSWALLLAGLAGVWAIGRRRLSSIGSSRIAQYRSRRK